MTANPVVEAILVAGARRAIDAANADEAFHRFVGLTGQDIPPAAFHDAVASCLRAGLIRDPVRLPEGALQCHWRLELSPSGRARLAAGGVISAD